jgi:hypothetical protein
MRYYEEPWTSLHKSPVEFALRDAGFYPTERSRLVADGTIFPLQHRPTLRLLPGEQAKFEREAGHRPV